MMEDQDSIFSDIKPTEVESSRIQRVFSRWADGAIEIGSLAAILFLLPNETFSRLIDGKSYMIYLIVIVLMTGYRLVCLLLFGRTIGMMVCRLKLLNKHLEPLSTKEKLLTFLPVNIPGIKYYKAF
jgi:uncharacterized RDD family membrane protein YckC